MNKLLRGAVWRRHLVAAVALVLLLPLAAPVFAKGPDAVDQTIDRMNLESKARARIVERVSPSVVNIMVVKKASGEDKSGPQVPPDMFNDPFFRRFFRDRIPVPPHDGLQRGLGSGIIVSDKGYVLTNNHVVGGADKITVKLPDGREFDAKVMGTDPASDVAVVKIDGKDLPVAKLGNSDDIAVGESVLAIGNPFGLEQTTTAGIVSAKGRSSLGITDYENFIQTDASINPGNSGGPLLNLRGEVVGMNTAIYANSGGNMGIGFAIPINQAHSVMDELVANGKVVRGYLGVVIQDVTP
ncbi:MAG TPA: trypsin-like peptidase domain-containing protein, partial [bacterium]